MAIDSLFKSIKVDNETARRLADILEHPKPPVRTGHALHTATPDEIESMGRIINRSGAYGIAMERGDFELAERIKSGEVSDEECFAIGESYEIEDEDTVEDEDGYE